MSPEIARGTSFGLSIENEKPLEAKQLGAIISSIGDAFERYVRRETKSRLRPTLVVASIRQGTINIIFDAWESLEKLSAAREYLAPFATHLIQIASLYSALNPPQKAPKKVMDADRKAVGSIVTPVANGAAVQINIIVNGDVGLQIDQATAQSICQSLSVPTPQQATAVAEPARQGLITDEESEALSSQGLEGTAFEVHGHWYARLRDGQGVLVPILGTVDLIDGALYRFRGHVVRGNRGEVIGINVTEASSFDRTGPA